MAVLVVGAAELRAAVGELLLEERQHAEEVSDHIATTARQQCFGRGRPPTFIASNVQEPQWIPEQNAYRQCRRPESVYFQAPETRRAKPAGLDLIMQSILF